MEKQVFEYGLMLASANPNSGTVGPSPLEKYRVSEIFNDLRSIQNNHLQLGSVH